MEKIHYLKKHMLTFYIQKINFWNVKINNINKTSQFQEWNYIPKFYGVYIQFYNKLRK